MNNIHDSEECKTEINKPIDFRLIKLTRFKRVGFTIKIIAVKSIDTKFGRSYILLDNKGRRTLGNKKINYFCDRMIGIENLKVGKIHYNNGEIMFYIRIGKSYKYNGFEYNEIKYLVHNWSLSKEAFERIKIQSNNTKKDDGTTVLYKWLCNNDKVPTKAV